MSSRSLLSVHVSGHIATVAYRDSHSSKTEVPPISTVRFVSIWTQCYQEVGYGVRLEMINYCCSGPRGPLTLRPVIFSLGICQRPHIRPSIATWPRWPKGTDHCSNEEYRCTHVDACVARTWISNQCVPCLPPVVHTSNISSCQKKTFSVFLWLWKIPLR